MDKSCHSGGKDEGEGEGTTTAIANSSNSKEQYLRQLNKLSHKISKPSSSSSSSSNTNNNTTTSSNPIIKNPPNSNNAFDNNQNNPPPAQAQQNLQQPPVYNINKNDFRDVVQKLTGSPAHHDRGFSVPPIQQPKPPSSRLQRIRPPPLAHVTNRPPPLLSCAPPPSYSSNFIHRPSAAPLSPLPPLPAVHAAAESPVSAYMRYLQNSISADPNSKAPQFSGFSPLASLVSPRWNSSTTDASQQQQLEGVMPPPSSQQQLPVSHPHQQSQFPFPSSPLPFGCLNSPRSPYPLLSPGSLFSPTSGQLNFPLSPTTVPVPSPRWRGL